MCLEHLLRTSRFLYVVILAFAIAGCSASAKTEFYGMTDAPEDNVLRYITGSEPESLDPAIPTGQPEARMLMALYDGLVEYDPRTMQPIPGIAESWEVGQENTEYIFRLRNNATFSNGDPITAHDIAYTFRRALDPNLAAKNAYLAHYIKYAQEYNSKRSFVRDKTGRFLLKSDLNPNGQSSPESTDDTQPVETESSASEFRRFIDGPERLTVPSGEKARNELFEKDPKLKAIAEGADLVPVRAEDIGVEAIDDLTFRIKLKQPAPFLIGLLGHQFFRIVHRPTIERFRKDWTKPENIVTSGAFVLKEHHPYDRVVVAKNPGYWDAEMVRLNGIEFYPLDEQTTMLNLYKTGRVDAIYNHTVPAAWVETIRQYKHEYMNHPEVAIEYYTVNVTKPPMNNLKVRQAFALAVDRDALAKFRKTTQPLIDFTPEGLFPEYEAIRAKVYERELAKIGSSLEEWKARKFDPAKARKLLGEAGFPVNGSDGNWSCPSFPVDQVEILYNTSDNNKSIAEFIQAQFKQNLGITLQLKNQEWKTFLNTRKNLEYSGLGRAGWIGDYMDPMSFLKLFYGKNNDSSTGWSNSRFDKLIDEANSQPDPKSRYEKMAEAEFMMIQDQPVLPWQTQKTNFLRKPYVKGLYPNPGTLHSWKFVYIEQDPAKWDRDVDNIFNVRDEWVTEQIQRLIATQPSAVEREKGYIEAKMFGY
ncbi:peptide ABC transporter substrate-binding protein [Leptolyngbya sp. 7M]|uniref:peptide ABC transporter substrate-binding protein n=1 Tax=Leptolyngbya sp. 7M TaxID=2812896 RepID=UPI001B8C7144|nr:peptide ABC transporter substrate-binding protein [Leptolyngbya sp. 7M]QYO65456.1 peptide ABC transporter substrate-binding protein [Leptolyngbya sp. 7M]